MIDDNIHYYTAVPDDDNDRVSDAADVCLGTVIPEPVPTGQLGVNRFALTDDDAIFDTTPPKGKGPRKVFTRRRHGWLQLRADHRSAWAR